MAGRKTSPFNGGSLIFRENQYAARNFGITAGSWSRQAIIPKPKFTFFVRFVKPAELGFPLNVDNIITLSNLTKLSNAKDGIVFQIKEIDRPKFDIKTETLHQYNKKRIIQTRIDYQQMTIAFHDDISDQVLRFWTDYYSYYYGDGRKFSSSNWSQDIVANSFNEGGQGGWGYLGRFNSKGEGTTLATSTPNRVNYLDRIEIYQFYGSEYTITSFINPKISVFDHDQNNYAEGAVGSGIRISFDYEGVIYDLERKQINPNDAGQLEQFGFNNEYFDIPSNQPTLPLSGLGRLVNRIINIGISKLPPATQFVARTVLSEARKRLRPGSSLLENKGISFGTRSLVGSVANVVNFNDTTRLAGQTPSKDLISSSAGVKKTVDQFGVFTPSASPSVVNVPQTNQTGINLALVNQSEALLGVVSTRIERPAGTNQTTMADADLISQFSQSYGQSASLAVDQNVAGSVATSESELTHISADANSVITTLPDGQFTLTEIGAQTMNSMRSPTSVVGVKRPIPPTLVDTSSASNDQSIQNLIAAETGVTTGNINLS